MIKINKNLENLKTSATLAINQKVIEIRNKNNEVFHFGFGQSPFPVHISIINSLIQNASNNKYLPSQGLEILRSTIAAYLDKYQNIQTRTENVLVGPGSKELLFQTILMLDGKFLIPKGSWVSYGPQVHSKGVDYVILDTEFENNYKLTSKTLKAYCKANPKEQKTLILNSPNNPTGAVYSAIELESLALVCREFDVIVLSDEIYSQINFTAPFSPSICEFYPEKTIVFGGLSKVFSAGGYRLGFMVLPEMLLYLQNIFLALFSETFSAVSSPIQYAAIEAFKMNHSLQLYITKSSKVLNSIAQYVYNELVKLDIRCTKPQGAFYMLIDFVKYGNKIRQLGLATSENLALYLLDHYKVALLPGSDFYFDKKEFIFRLAYVDFDGNDVLNGYHNNSVIDEYFIEINCPHIFKGVQQLKNFVQKL